jgi:predicted 3-demethylubiquinone-9 3-methyltransferase (glyoxalase superfamily)
MTNPIYSCLWFDGKAKEAANFYCTIFKDGKILSENPMVVIFEINHTKFMGLNGGPLFQFNEAVSFVVECATQEEIDHYWEKLCAGGSESRCGWLKDKFGVSWQIIPKNLGELMSNPEKAQRVGNAIMQMNKLNMEILNNA